MARKWDFTVLHNSINLRGMKEQAFQFTANKLHGGMRGCYTRGCELFTPLQLNLNDIDLTGALTLDRMHSGEGFASVSDYISLTIKRN